MKNILALLCFILLFNSCIKDDTIDNSNGTKLIAIDYKDNGTANRKEIFSYNNEGLINQIENLQSFGNRYQIIYNNGQLQEFTTYSIDDDKIVSRDSISYNINGTIRAIYNFTTYPDEKLKLRLISEFEYSSNNRVTEKKGYAIDKAEYTSIEKYYWNNKNIVKTAIYNGENILRYEISYHYDSNINYKKDIPIYISDPINWSDHNVVKTSFNDFTGIIDLSCYVCVTSYRYNTDKYPTFIKYDWGRELILSYE